jgi:hypothetical protein
MPCGCVKTRLRECKKACERCTLKNICVDVGIVSQTLTDAGIESQQVNKIVQSLVAVSKS